MAKLEGFEFWKKSLNASKYVVAPMVDQSELAWRMLSRKYGAQLCFTPMYHAAVFVRDSSYRTEALQTCPEDRPLIVQFCANDPEIFLKAAQLAEGYCDAIDLNLGCPQTIAKRGHYGAFLQDEWDLLKTMVSLCHEKLKVPITCKVRVYETVEKTVLYAKMLEKAGCQLLTVHGRTKEMKGRYTGLANWDYIKAVRENVSIPVFANGNIQYLSDVERCISETGVAGVMSAEGNLHNPALFHGIDPPVYQMGEEYIEMAEKYPCPLSYARGHLFKMFHHSLTVHPDIRNMIGVGRSLDCFKLAILKLKERCLKDMEEYKKSPEKFQTELPFPYWICQPYVRPNPYEEKNKDAVKRPLEEKIQSPEFAGLSKNKVKKILRNPNKKFNGGREDHYEKCVQCANCRGRKCVFMMCKVCCKKKTWSEELDCKGHGIMLRTRKLSKQRFEEKKQEMEEQQMQQESKQDDSMETNKTLVKCDSSLNNCAIDEDNETDRDISAAKTDETDQLAASNTCDNDNCPKPDNTCDKKITEISDSNDKT